jgi:flagellar hook-basal body complex protein FliE
MNNSIAGLRILPVETGRIAGTATPRAERSSFTDSLSQAMDEVENLQTEAQEQATALLEGNGADIHSAMIAVEKADLSFQLMMQVRNKIVAAYQEITRMQF